jgi:hypothetical protein
LPAQQKKKKKNKIEIEKEGDNLKVKPLTNSNGEQPNLNAQRLQSPISATLSAN